MIGDRSQNLASQVEIRVIRHAQRRGAVARRFRFNQKNIFIRHRIRHRDIHVSGVALFAVRAQVLQPQRRRAVRAIDRRAFQIRLSNPQIPPCK